MPKRLLVICEGPEAWRSTIRDADTGEMLPGLVTSFEAFVDVSHDAPLINLYLDIDADTSPLADVEEIEFRIVKTRMFNFWQQKRRDDQDPRVRGT